MGFIFSNADELNNHYIIPRQNIIVKSGGEYFVARYIGNGEYIRLNIEGFIKNNAKREKIIFDKKDKQKSKNYKILPYVYDIGNLTFENIDENVSEEEKTKAILKTIFSKYDYVEYDENFNDVESKDNTLSDIINSALEKTQERKHSKELEFLYDSSL